MPLEAIRLTKSFGQPATRILHGIDLAIGDGEFVSITGRSGSGKSTLLYLLSSLDLPTSGNIKINGHDTAAMGVEEIHDLRNSSIGFVFQFHHLLPELTSLENVLLPARRHAKHAEKEPYALELLERFGLKGQERKRPSQLSGGEQQRVAIARALVMDPKYIFADEPTGNLDSQNGSIVMEILKQANRERGATVVLVTHEPDFAAMAAREVFLIDGRVSSDRVRSGS
jgi:lipoprotein-releasing system ATP-binding protein